MDIITLFVNIVSIAVSLISILISVETLQEKPCISLGLLMINLFFLIILAMIMIPNGNKVRKYKNLIENNKYYSFLYTNYIDIEKPYKTRKISKLNVVINISKVHDEISDIREYEFDCKSKNKEILLYFLNETGSISNPSIEVNGQEKYTKEFEGVGFDVNIPEINNIINKLNIILPCESEKQNESNKIKCSYGRIYKSDSLIYIIYPKMFSNYKTSTNITVHLNEKENNIRFELESIGANGKKSEGSLKKLKESGFEWKGKVKPNRVYILRGTLNSETK